jgi:hypothetical protein
MVIEKMRWLYNKLDCCRESEMAVEKGNGCIEKERAVEKRRWL